MAELGGDAGSGSGSGDEPAVALFGHSSGAILALEAAAAGVPTRRLALYEAPYIIGDGTRDVPADDLFEQVTAAVAAGDRQGAVELFLVEGVGVPTGEPGHGQGRRRDLVDHDRPGAHAAVRRGGVRAGQRPAGRPARGAPGPTLALDGGESPPWFHNAMAAVAATVPGARYVTIPGHDHGILAHPETMADGLTGFLS